jgi:hypothetical protein
LVSINPKTLTIDREGGIRTRPEQIHQALRELAGVAEHDFAKRFPLDLKGDEKLVGFWGV